MVAITPDGQKGFQFPKGSGAALALSSPAHHTLTIGARGSMKTSAQLLFVGKHIGMGYGPFMRAIILNREFDTLANVVAQSKKFFGKIFPKAKWYASKSDYKWVWPTGEELLFRWVKRDQDYDKWHGDEFAIIGFDELGGFSTSYLYDKFMSCNRSSFQPLTDTPTKGGVYQTHDGQPLPPMPRRFFSTTNPYGPGLPWISRRFLNVASYGQLHRKIIKDIYDHETESYVDVELTQVALFGHFNDNPYLSPQDRANYIELCRNNPALYDAWIKGIVSRNPYGALGDLWNPTVHKIPRFKVPSNWHIDRSFDWGSSSPYSAVYFAESNGEEFTDGHGKKRCLPAGSLVQFGEVYGTNDIGSNRGTRETPRQVAERMLKYEQGLQSHEWIARRVAPGPADNQIYDVTRTDVDCVGDVMADAGVRFVRSDKSKGAVAGGLQLMRERMKNATDKEGPGLYFMDNCQASIELLPELPLDNLNPETICRNSENHIADAVRYRCLKSSNRMATTLKVSFG